MLLSELFESCPEIEIKQLSIDSRLPMKDCIFFCLSGIRYDGHDYINEAIKNGANVIVYEDDDVDTSLNAIFIKVNNVANCLNSIASKFYGNPEKEVESYVVCGCEGQSSVNHIIANIINKYKPCASIGILGINYGSHHLSTSYPTLTILDNFKYLNEFKKNNIKAAVFETEVLSLSYKKLDSINPKAFIYTSTNQLSGSYKEIGFNYYDALCNYLYCNEDDVLVVLNRDDESYEELSKAVEQRYVSYGFDSDSDYLIADIDIKNNETYFSLLFNNEVHEFKMNLLGLSNIYNAAAAIVTLIETGYPIDDIKNYLKDIPSLEGIVEKVDKEYNIYVDCANNVNDIKAIYDFATTIKQKDAKIYVVWGINSSDEEETIKEIALESKGKIYEMILTENNTYNGNIFGLINKTSHYFDDIKVIVVEDRYIAIESAIELLNKNDILLILGKGNETTITRNLGRQTYLGDKNIALEVIKRIKNEENNEYY